MRTVRTFRADGGNLITIAINREIPRHEGTGWLARQREEFQQEAENIVDALEQSLPGGLLDRVAAEMMKRKASDLIVPTLRVTQGVRE